MRLVNQYGSEVDIKKLPTMVYTADRNICIHKIRQCGDNWYLNCYALGLNDYNLQTTDFREAIIRSKIELCCKLKKLDEAVSGFINFEIEEASEQ
jgi:hypothetical protein